MSGKLLFLLFVSVFVCLFAVNFDAQTVRKAVGATEVNGTFRSPFGGKFKGSASEIKILAVGAGKLKVRFDLVYPYVDSTGGLMANVGTAEGTAQIAGDTAVYQTEDEYGKCRITIKFVRPGEIKVREESENSGCGFGVNVNATGTYRKTSAAKPKF
ncbi:MAG TPA: hypothetical protein VF692_03255 [Pyrinomonadaceae bacterium]|jgi:hypothetical protein